MQNALRRWAAIFAFALPAGAAAAQAASAPASPPPIPSDRAADSYLIYSLLLPGNHIEWGTVPRSFWLVEDTTEAEPSGSPCATAGAMNPHQSIRPPESRKVDFAELLADFDAHCHNRYLLDASQLHVALPVRLLDEQARSRFVSHVAHFMPPDNNIMQAPPTPDEFKGAAGMHSFSAVFFNPTHTLAMTQIGMYCGGLCGNWSWVVLERRNGQWQALPWVRMRMIS